MSKRFENLKIDHLWNDDHDQLTNEQYHKMVIEQYKVYVEMADRASFRRISINLFFLVTNIFIIGVLAIGLSRNQHQLSATMLFIPYLGVLAICYAWWRVVRFYRHTVQIKDQVIGAIEKRLPSSPLWQAERTAAEEKGSFTPLKRLETNMPFVFMALYTGIYIYLIALMW